MDDYYYLFSVKLMILGNACDVTQTKAGSLENKLIYNPHDLSNKFQMSFKCCFISLIMLV